MYSIKNCIIIGAGISGLIAARRLRENGVEVTLIDDRPLPGGRIGTVHEGKCTFDHGAQFVTTRDRVFRELVESWNQAGILKPWYKGPLGNMRYVGAKGMQQFAAYLAKDLNIHSGETVTYLHFKKDKWTVTTQAQGAKETRHYEADFIILTPPVPQSLKLLQESNIELDYDEEEHLKRIVYTKCISMLAQFEGPAGISLPGAMDLNLDTLRWLGDNSYKGISEVDGCLTINSSPRFADLHWETPDETVVELMVKAAKPFIRARFLRASVHRWAYSEPTKIYKEKQPFRSQFFLDSGNRLALCGDGFGGGRLEAAAVSAWELSSELNRAI